jgi:hypothetical protein
MREKGKIISEVEVIKLVPQGPLDTILSLMCGCFHPPANGQEKGETGKVKANLLVSHRSSPGKHLLAVDNLAGHSFVRVTDYVHNLLRHSVSRGFAYPDY